jgi:hypothetical protein
MKTAAVGVAVATALVLASAAWAEMPNNNGLPEVTGRAAVGWGVVGHNGSWLYLDGSACGAECTYEFVWERCNAAGCRPLLGAYGRVYKVRAVDIGRRLRVVVSTTKYDCGATNTATGTQECRYVTRTAASVPTAIVAAPKTRRAPKPPRSIGSDLPR